ncbi:MAG: helix-turn-helix transcriptional regulator [Verrucomicrobiota bacterium]
MPREELLPELKEFGEKVRRERLKRSLTQEKVAERAGIALRTLQKIESGQINILITTARRLREALGAKWNDLL